jgi:hypothetical protein
VITFRGADLFVTPAKAGVQVVAFYGSAFNLEKAVNHGGHSEHGEKPRAYVDSSQHPLGKYEKRPKTQAFRCARRVRRG